jgi:hypothetical protein
MTQRKILVKPRQELAPSAADTLHPGAKSASLKADLKLTIVLQPIKAI